MTTAIIITICSLLLFAYVFDISSSKTKVPSVILLLLLGWGVRQIVNFLGFNLPNLTSTLPIFGTIGLIMIVLEGSLDIELNRSKMLIIGKSIAISLLSILMISVGLAFVFQYAGHITFKFALANAIPFAIISSAIAIPSARYLKSSQKEFVIYESSMSDIFGVIFFNFIINDNLESSQTIRTFFLQIVVIILISFVVTIALAFLLSEIKHHVKYTPIILLVILIYSISKMYHLPSLIFILVFGLFLGNVDKLKYIKRLEKFHSEILNSEVIKFKELTMEFSFLIRSLFFLLFGYLMETSELLNMETIPWAIGITVCLFIVRAILLTIFRIPLKPIFYIAPRGLITILLFLSIPFGQSVEIANKSLIIQVIILTALVMMFGLMKKNNDEVSKYIIDDEIIKDETYPEMIV
ncbi:MAG: cation:proton antiporter [Bacteroidales bacterium]|nr:cation:proton antiporter [Bacteroidales bacterium]